MGSIEEPLAFLDLVIEEMLLLFSRITFRLYFISSYSFFSSYSSVPLAVALMTGSSTLLIGG
jgi:hypothetical protein